MEKIWIPSVPRLEVGEVEAEELLLEGEHQGQEEVEELHQELQSKIVKLLLKQARVEVLQKK
jgi:hypothetical protein